MVLDGISDPTSLFYLHAFDNDLMDSVIVEERRDLKHDWIVYLKN